MWWLVVIAFWALVAGIPAFVIYKRGRRNRNRPLEAPAHGDPGTYREDPLSRV